MHDYISGVRTHNPHYTIKAVKAACTKILMSTLEVCCINITNSILCYLEVILTDTTQMKSSVTWSPSVLAGLKKQLGSAHWLPVPERDGPPLPADSPLLMSPCWTHTCACIMVTLLNSHRGLFRPGGHSCGITLPTG